jgi:hypothetical protein
MLKPPHRTDVADCLRDDASAQRVVPGMEPTRALRAMGAHGKQPADRLPRVDHHSPSSFANGLSQGGRISTSAERAGRARRAGEHEGALISTGSRHRRATHRR